ncbi:MAG: ATP-binding protein [candidate division KSB1 bacterium]|nr:ATP-binding protein [candidate division KSB1 bacterium]MDZ7300526.1 ATP-binding protein [candidate division KSB1 bacterium]MDZ7309665.1 ATP-binding protein [candidate division KSB1 bacterium]
MIKEGGDGLPQVKKKYQLRIPSQTDNLELIREFVARVARKVGFKDDDVSKIELAVDEACANVIKHAYKRDDKKPIDIVIQIDYRKFTVIITDHGCGFDPKKIKTPDMKEYLAEMRVGGLGIYLMRTLMDEIDFDIKPGKRNQVIMSKYFLERKSKHAHPTEVKSPR